jgi:hypothetical protein
VNECNRGGNLRRCGWTNVERFLLVCIRARLQVCSLSYIEHLFVISRSEDSYVLLVRRSEVGVGGRPSSHPEAPGSFRKSFFFFFFFFRLLAPSMRREERERRERRERENDNWTSE